MFGLGNTWIDYTLTYEDGITVGAHTPGHRCLTSVGLIDIPLETDDELKEAYCKFSYFKRDLAVFQQDIAALKKDLEK